MLKIFLGPQQGPAMRSSYAAWNRVRLAVHLRQIRLIGSAGLMQKAILPPILLLGIQTKVEVKSKSTPCGYYKKTLVYKRPHMRPRVAPGSHKTE